MTIEELYKIYQQYPSVQTDTRKLKAGDLFFALKGDNFNGNKFANAALAAGAAFSIVDEKEYLTSEKTILVKNVLETLQLLALHHRKQFNIPFLAITGSNGKTTTKELIHAVLSSFLITYTTEGNLNNQIGIPLTILRIKPDAEIAVIEMGANHQKEIAAYCEYTMPTHGIITNCGKAHLEGFGSIEGIKKGKGELFDFLRTNNGTAFVMWDYDYLQELSNGISALIKYGTNETDIIGLLKKNGPFLSVEIIKGFETGIINTQLVGDYNLPNVLAAVTVGKYFNIPNEKIKNSIENYTPSNSRSQLISIGTNNIILDAYNANPTSLKLAIENFSRYDGERKVLILGAMAELGKDSLHEHSDIINLINKNKWTNVVLVGGDFLKIKHPYISLNTSIEAREWLQLQNFENTNILIKGSRSFKMEQVIEH